MLHPAGSARWCKTHPKSQRSPPIDWYSSGTNAHGVLRKVVAAPAAVGGLNFGLPKNIFLPYRTLHQTQSEAPTYSTQTSLLTGSPEMAMGARNCVVSL